MLLVALVAMEAQHQLMALVDTTLAQAEPQEP
jgi:hypothetical protein